MPSPVFTHQKHADGGFYSVCASCLEIAASAPREEQLSTSELMHACDPIRLYQISQGWIRTCHIAPLEFFSIKQKAEPIGPRPIASRS